MTSEARRIGGEFEIDRAGLDFETPASVRPSLGAACETWLDTGRSALAVVARELARNAGQAAVWLPAYGCESMAAPFRRAGLRLRYYAVGAALDRIDAEPAPGDALLFVHYFGRRNREALRRIATWRAASVRVIEDCAQAALTQGVGTHGDYALTSLRKLLPQPDGALLASRRALHVDAEPADEAFVSARIVGKLQRGAGLPASVFLPLFEASEARLAADRPRHMSWLSGELLARSDLASVAARRRANFAALVTRLETVTPLFTELGDGEVPLGLPVVVGGGQRDALRRHLADRHGIYCALHWDLAHLPEAGFAAERELSAAILTLPIDQRYGAREMAFIADAVAAFEIGARP